MGTPRVTIMETAEVYNSLTPKLSKAGVPTHGEDFSSDSDNSGDLRL